MTILVVQGTKKATKKVASRLPFQVYIEHTDAFQIMYNSNYPCITERCLSSQHKDKARRMTKSKTMKFLKPAVLGDSIDFIATPGRADSLSVTAYRTRNQQGEPEKGEEIFKATGVVCSEQLDGRQSHRARALDTCHISEFDIYDDELHHDLLSTKTVFNLFERARTNILGGPDRLLDLSASGYNIVVARVSDYSLYSLPLSAMNVKVSTTTSMMMESVLNFDQEISSPDGTLLAQATVSCLCVDPENSQSIPFPHLPQLTPVPNLTNRKGETITVHSLDVKCSTGKIFLSRLPKLQDLTSLKSIHKVDTVISLTESSEMDDTLGSCIQENGMDWIHFPIGDYSVPDEESNATWEQDLQPQIMSMLAKEGKNVLFHCKGGCGRSGMLAYRMLIKTGEDEDIALKRLRKVRPCAIETDAQLQWALRETS